MLKFAKAYNFNLYVYLVKDFFMTTKLNLTVDEETAKEIKKFAVENNTSVSKLADEYFKKLVKKKEKKTNFREFIDKYAGSVSRSKPIDIKEEKDAYLKEKYGI